MARQDGSRRHSADKTDRTKIMQGRRGLDYEKIVMVEFFCDNGHDAKILGSFYRFTALPADSPADGADMLTVEVKPRPDQTLPMQSEDGHIRARLYCDACGRDKVLKPEKIEQGLAAIWKPDTRCVVSYRI